TLTAPRDHRARSRECCGARCHRRRALRHNRLMQHVELDALEAGVEAIRRAPKDAGTVELIVRRPAENERELLDEAELDAVEGLIGDNWHTRGSRATEDGSAHPDLQLTLMNARVTALVAQTPERWPL